MLNNIFEVLGFSRAESMLCDSCTQHHLSRIKGCI